MIRYEDSPSNIFECLYPPLPPEEELIWMSHPQYPFDVSNHGTVRPNSHLRVECVKGRVKVSKQVPTGHRMVDIGSIYRCTMEAFTQELHPNKKIVQLNHNPYDTRIENQYLTQDFTKQERLDYLQAEKQFVQNSLNVMLQKTYALMDVDKAVRYFEFMRVEPIIMKQYKKTLKQHNML